MKNVEFHIQLYKKNWKKNDNPILGRKPVFIKEQEAEMATQIKNYCVWHLNLREKNGIKHYFSTKSKLAGTEWLQGPNNNSSVGKGKSRFRAKGIFPIDPSAFKDEDLLAVETLNDP